MLAERFLSRALLASAALAALTLAFAFALQPSPRSSPSLKHSRCTRIAAPPIDYFACPAHVRAAIRVENPIAMFCRDVEGGVFVVAQYRTTELWHRTAVVAHDGRLVEPLVDQPSLGTIVDASGRTKNRRE